MLAKRERVFGNGGAVLVKPGVEATDIFSR